MEGTLAAAVLLTIFFGAFLDAMVFTCLFVFGEAVFLLAGGLAYTTGSALPILAAYGGAYIADQSNYGIGRFYRRMFNRIALANSRRRRAVRRATALLRSRGVLMIAASRFMGPIAWVTPPLAGSLLMNYVKFAVGSLLGVLLGVGQFLLLGWIGAYGAERGGFDPQRFLTDHFWTLFFAGQGLLIGLGIIWRVTSSIRQ